MKDKKFKNIDLVERWKNHVYMEPFKNDTHDRNNAAILLENTLTPLHVNDDFERIRGEITSKAFHWMQSKKIFSVQASLLNEQSEYLYLDSSDNNLTIHEKKCTIEEQDLKVQWNSSFLEQFQSPHKWNAERDLIDIIATEISGKIDRKLVNTAMENCGTECSWDFCAAIGDTIKEKYESLYVKVVEVSNIIGKKTVSSSYGNFLVTSPEVASILETATAGFAPRCSDDFVASLGIHYVGTINNRWRLFKDPLFPTGKLLVGHGGNSFLDSGIYFVPQILASINSNDKSKNGYNLKAKYTIDIKPSGQNYYAVMNITNFID